MGDDTIDQLSALVDDELDRDELRFLVRRLGHDWQALRQLGRFCLIREAFRGGVAVHDERLTERVAAALRDEPALTPVNGGSRRRLLRPVAGVAVAASVAIATLALWPQQAERGITEQPAPAVAGAGNGDQLQLASESDDTAEQRWSRLDPQVQQRLNGYLVNHSGYSSRGKLGGVVSFSRIAGHDGAD